MRGKILLAGVLFVTFALVGWRMTSRRAAAAESAAPAWLLDR